MLIAELIVLALFCVIGLYAIIDGKGNGFSIEPLYNADTFSVGLVFARSRSRCCRSSASTGSRRWPRRTATAPAASGAR